ncbi:MAG: hypothetical protein OEN20_03810, partial [Gammaproteobacteria bacterium]|nr:hypothetical protein [Gammaproteobacteria bacterium]
MHRLTMVLSATLLAMSPVAAQAASTNAVALAQKKAAIIGSLHKKAKKALVNAAQDKSFEAFLGASDESHRHAAKKRVDEVSLNVQSRFHVEEMCLIDASGPELARIVGNKIADDLSPDESEAIFFGPSFAQRPRTVFVSPLYMSPDAHKWVL